MSSKSFSGLVLMSCHGQGVGQGDGMGGYGGPLRKGGFFFCGGLWGVLGPGLEVVLSLVF